MKIVGKKKICIYFCKRTLNESMRHLLYLGNVIGLLWIKGEGFHQQ